MDILFYLASACLVLFMVLATYDGFYLHLWKYQLFNQEESIFEHKTHTIRAILFPAIVWLLMVNETSSVLFLIGLVLVTIDLIVLAIDAYSEKDSRDFMGGLPRWEYIIHLFSNAFHFSAIVLVLAIKIDVTATTISFVEAIPASSAKNLFAFIGANVIPGAVVLAILHVILLLEKPKGIWNTYRMKITCC